MAGSEPTTKPEPTTNTEPDIEDVFRTLTEGVNLPVIEITVEDPVVGATTVSAKGQIVLPAAVRARMDWPPGTGLMVVETREGILLKPAPVFAPSRIEDVRGMLRHSGPVKTIEEMDAGVLEEARRRHARD